MSSTSWYSILMSQAWNLPYLLIFVAGIVLAIINWQRHPTVSLLTVLAFSIFLGNILLGLGIHIWQIAALEGGWTGRNVGLVLSVLGAIRALIGSVAWVVLLTALFGWRTNASAHSGKV